MLGPGINPKGTSESFNIVKQMGDGTMKMGAPDLKLGCVDVRDVADAHYNAGFMPSANGRHITSAENMSFLGLADMLRPKYGNEYPLPKKNLPKWLMMLLGPLSGIPRQFIRDNVGYPWNADNSKIKSELGIKFRSIDVTINEFFQQLIDNNIFSKKK